MALFSTLEQTDCALIVHNSKRVTSFFSFFNYAYWISTEVVYLKCCLGVKWLVPCETAATLAHYVHTIQPCTVSCLFMLSDIWRVHAYFAATCTFGRMTRSRISFTCYCAVVTWGWNKYLKKVKSQPREDNSPAGTWTCNLLIMSQHSNHWAIVAPHMYFYIIFSFADFRSQKDEIQRARMNSWLNESSVLVEWYTGETNWVRKHEQLSITYNTAKLT